MESNNFISILEEIHEKVEKLRLSGVSKNEDGWLSGEVSEYFNYQQRGLELYFFLYLWYVGILNDDIPSDEMDVTILLNISDNVNKKKILEIWESINSELHHTFPKWMKIIGKFHLNQYRSKKNSITLVEWINGKYLYFLNDGGFKSTRLLLNIIEKTASEIGIEKNNKRMLVLGDEEKFYLDFFTGKIVCNHCTLCPEKEYYYNCSLLNSLLLGDNKIQVLKRENENKVVFPFEDARFDTIYSFIYKEDKKDTQYMEKVLKLLDNSGLGYMFYQPYNIRIDNKWFDEYDYPLIASSVDGTFYLCRNSNLQNKVRSIVIGESDSQLDFGEGTIDKHFVGLINSSSIADDYQELTKEDFLYAPANTPLNKIFRQPDQMSFVYKPISTILSYSEYNHNVPAIDLSDDQIIENKVLSNNPFNLSLSPVFYLEHGVVNDLYTEKIKNESFLFEENAEWSEMLDVHFLDKHFQSVAEELSIKDSADNVSPHDRNLLECRIMRSRGILWDGNKKFYKVNASEERPICYRQCFFYFEEYSLYCNQNIREINISSEYDEDFIIYQICNHKRKHFQLATHILVAPTREEQKAYFLKKREEYRLKNADLVNEIRNEERRKISIDLHYLKHDAAHYLSKISSAKSLFKGRLEKGPLNQTDFFKSGNTVKDYLEDIGKCVSHVTSFLEQMTFLTDVLPQKPMEICQILQDLADNTLITNKYVVELELSESIKGVKCLLDERIHKAFDNILSNAERHAFIDKKRKDYKVKINGVKEGDVVIVTFSNNGTSPDPTLTEEGFFTRGLHVGPTGHSGFGGSIIRETIEAQNGIVHLHINENSEYPFQIEIKLPVYYD